MENEPRRRGLLPAVVGELQWRPPPWLAWLWRKLAALGAWLKAHRKGAAAAVVAMAVLCAGGYYGWRWYDRRPKPARFTASTHPPGLTRLEEGAKPDPVRVHFSGSVARLDQLGKKVAQGVKLSPAQPGEWKWENDRTLLFTPSADWPVGQPFTVSFDKAQLFPTHVQLEEYEVTFTTAPFTARLVSSALYQDPRNPKVKRVVATVGFSHAVDSALFGKLVSIKAPLEKKGLFGATEKELPFTVSFDKLKSEAYLQSDPVGIPEQDGNVRVVVKGGARAASGGPPFSSELAADVRIPGMFTYFHVDAANVTLVKNERFEPEQVLVLQLTDGVSEAELQKNLSVWLLPKDLPKVQGREGQKGYRWSDPSIVGPEVLSLAKALKPQAVPTDKELATLHSFKLDEDPGRYVYLRLKKGTTSGGGYVLAEDYHAIAAVPRPSEEVTLLHDGALLALSGERKVSVLARDVKGLRWELGRVLPGQVSHLVSQTRGRFSQPSFMGYFNEDQLVERFYETQALEPLGRGKAQYAALDLTPYLTPKDGSGKRGLFFLKVASWDPERKRETGRRDARLVLVTDLGLVVKDSADGSHDVFVQSLEKGEAAAGVTVSLLGKNGLAVTSATTDAEGHVSFPNVSGFAREQEPTVYVARRGEDLAFIPFDREDRKLNLTRYDVGGLYGASAPDRLTAFLFSDRGLYRPGDTFHVAFMVKPTDWAQSIAGLPLEVTVTDPRGMEVQKQKLSLSPAGLEAVSYQTEESSPTGGYQVSLYIYKDGRRGSLLGSTAVRVEEFLPDRMKISTRFSAERLEGWVSPEGLKGQVSLKNLFGIPAASRRVSAELVLSPAYPAFRAYRDYTFFDPLQAKKSFTERLADATTDAQGEAELPLSLERFERATYRVSLLAEGYEAGGGRGVSAEAVVLVSPRPYLVGYKPDGELSYVTKGAARAVQLIAVDPSLKKVAVKGLKATLVERRWVSVLVQQRSGLFQYQSEEKEVPVSKKELAVGAEGATFALATDQPGDFTLVLKDAEDAVLAQIRYSVAGNANLARALEKNAELQLTLAKGELAPGEELEVQIKAPYVGAGLITLERDRVYAHRWFKTDTTSSVQRIRLPAGLEGNGYVSVAFVRSMSSPEIFMSPLSYAAAPFTVNRDARVNAIELNVPELSRPGEPYRIRYKGQKPGKAVLYAVDEGILQVAGYATPDPLAHFFKKRALEVRTSQILDLLLPEFSVARAASASGGDAEEAIGKNLNPFKRKRDTPAAYWSGVVDIDTTERELVYTPPDSFNGTLRVMAVAVSPSAVGAAAKKSTIRGPFVLSPNVPTFVAPGDEVQVTVAVANTLEGSGKDAAVGVELVASEHFDVVGGASQSLSISEGREATATYKLKAKARPGGATLTFVASHGGKRAKQTVGVSVRPATTYVTTTASGSVTDGKVTVPVPRKLFAEHRTLELTASPLPLGLARGLIHYLDNFPYACTEQLVSRTFPAVVLKARPEFGYSAKEVNDAFSQAVRLLRARQNDEGAFGFWAANSYASPLQAAHAVLFLTEAKERGLPVPPELLTRALGYLKARQAGRATDLADARERAYGLYLLARNGEANGSATAALREQLDARFSPAWKGDATAVHLAGAYKLTKQDKLAEKALDGAKLGLAQAADYRHYYDGLSYDAQLLYLLSRHFPARLASVDAAGLLAVAGPIQRGSYNTLTAAQAVLALDAYATALGDKAKVSALNVKLLEKVDGKQRPLAVPEGLFPKVAFSDAATELEVRSEEDVPLFWQVTQAGFDTELPKQEVKQRLEVQHELQGLDGKVLQELPLGAEAELHLKVRAVGGAFGSQVALVDLLPAGFEVVMDRASAEQPEEEAQEASSSEGDGDEGGYREEGEGEAEGEPAEEEAPPEPQGRSDARPAAYGYVPPIGAEKSTFRPEYVDVREDRVVLYGTVGDQVTEFVYRVKATNQGTFVLPPAFGEGMYDRAVLGRSLPGKVTVKAP